MALELVIAAFSNGAVIPQLHTCDGADLSPTIEWHGEPSGTRSYALIVDDPDAPAGTWNHWLLWDIPTSVQAIAQGFRHGRVGVSGKNDFGKLGYGGPCPPRGHGSHRYYFRLHALDIDELGLNEGATRKNLDQALTGHILQTAEYMGRYERR